MISISEKWKKETSCQIQTRIAERGRKPTIDLFPLGSTYADKDDYLFFFLCLFLRKRFLRLCVAILCLFLFFPQGITPNILLIKN